MQKKGKGKECYYNRSILFEGELLNGVRNGKGRKYYANGELLFEGEYLNGKKMEKEKNIMITVN